MTALHFCEICDLTLDLHHTSDFAKLCSVALLLHLMLYSADCYFYEFGMKETHLLDLPYNGFPVDIKLEGVMFNCLEDLDETVLLLDIWFLLC